ncbi:hypothetical protein TNCV_4077151 [Trichonephila clavipes]|nr:hypothetical protein TNCV_4077151 [Trichonephila clavipes]
MEFGSQSKAPRKKCERKEILNEKRKKKVEKNYRCRKSFSSKNYGKETTVSQYGNAAAGKRWNILLNKVVESPVPCLDLLELGASVYLTGHDYFQRCLHRIGVKDSACYPLCHQVEMDGHHLRHCPIVLKSFL